MFSWTHMHLSITQSDIVLATRTNTALEVLRNSRFGDSSCFGYFTVIFKPVSENGSVQKRCAYGREQVVRWPTIGLRTHGVSPEATDRSCGCRDLGMATCCVVRSRETRMLQNFVCKTVSDKKHRLWYVYSLS